MTLGFFGCGNMGTAILRGVLAAGLFEPASLLVYDINTETAAALASQTGTLAAESPAALLAQSDAVLLAVKPNVLPEVLRQNAAQLASRDPLLISIAAGKTLVSLQACLTSPARLVRVMPNLNAAVGAAVSAYCGNERASEADLAFTQKLCAAFGTVLPLPETQFPLFGVLGGCAPAFVFLFLDALAQAGVKNGLTKAAALDIAAQVTIGSAKLLQESQEHPRRLIDSVCSPGGTTIEGITALQAHGFESAVHAAVQAALEKDAKM